MLTMATRQVPCRTAGNATLSDLSPRQSRQRQCAIVPDDPVQRDGALKAVNLLTQPATQVVVRPHGSRIGLPTHSSPIAAMSHRTNIIIGLVVTLLARRYTRTVTTSRPESSRRLARPSTLPHSPVGMP